MTAPRRALPLLADLPEAPRNPTRECRRGRTAHWNATWPDRFDAGMRIEAAARDLVTRRDGEPAPFVDARLRVHADLAACCFRS